MEYKRSFMKKLYIFCVPTLKNIQILKNLYFLLASGCEMGDGREEFAVRPVFFMNMDRTIDDALQKLEKLRQHYEKIRTDCFFGANTASKFFRTRIVEAYTISNSRQNEHDESAEMLKLLFQHDSQTYSKGLEWEQFFRSTSPNSHVRITEQDKVAFLVSADKPEQTILAKLLFEKKWVKKASDLGLFIDLSSCNTEENKSLLDYGLTQITNVRHQFFVPNTGKLHFDILQTAVALVDFLSKQDCAGLINVRKNTAYYQSYNISDLSNVEVQNNIIRFYILSNLVSSRYKSEIKSWQKNYVFSVNGVENSQLDRIKDFTQIFAEWIYEIRNDFRLMLSERIDKIQLDQKTSIPLSDMFQYLNKLPPLRELNNAEKRRKLVLSLADSTYHLKICSEQRNEGRYVTYSLGKPAPLLFSEWKQIPNPFALFLLYRHSFDQSKDIKYLQQRSYCLDLWEMFFCVSKELVEKHFVVEEAKLKTCLTGHYCDVINTYNEYGKVFADSMEVFYSLKERNTNRVIAYSSPYTGFCVRHDDANCLAFGEHIFFSNKSAEWKELRQRSQEFRIFMKKYVAIIPTFSPAFVDYVNESLSLDERVQANSVNFFECYAQFNNHIPVVDNIND